MWTYMIKISDGIAYEQNWPMGVTSALMAQFGFLAKSGLKMRCTKKIFTKVVTNHNTQLLIQNIFWSPQGFDLCPGGTIRIFWRKVPKKCVLQKLFSDKSCYKSKPANFILCNIFRYLAPFWRYSGIFFLIRFRSSLTLFLYSPLEKN